MKAVYYAGPVHPRQSPQLRRSSVGLEGQGTVAVQHDAVHSEVAILVKVFAAQTIQADLKETTVSEN